VNNGWTSSLDVTNHSLIIDVAPGAETTTLNTVSNQVKSALNLSGGGFWNGAGGITSSTAAADPSHLKGIGVAVAADVFGISATGTSIWAGQTVDGSSILATYTYFGDANLDGIINIDDFAEFDFNYNASNAGWLGGDFNYDGITDKDNDFSILIDAYQNQGAPITPAIAAIIAHIEGQSVPEPGGGAIVIGAAAIGMRRRRRQQQRAELSSGRGVK
jgi:hypothetical protein